MIPDKIKPSRTKAELYDNLIEIVQSVTSSETNFISNCANVASLLFHALNQTLEETDSTAPPANVNWAGFYFVDFVQRGTDLCLGPFHGKVACTRIKFGRGVCGRCQKEQKPVIVPNVHEFEGHIVCDSASNSEICVPIFRTSHLDGAKHFVGLIDIDSPNFSQFDEIDAKGLTEIARILEKNCDWSLFNSM